MRIVRSQLEAFWPARVSACHCATFRWSIGFIIFMDKSQCVAKFMNGDRPNTKLSLGLRVGTFKSPVLECKVESHAAFQTIQLSPDGFGVRILVRNANSNSAIVVIACFPS